MRPRRAPAPWLVLAAAVAAALVSSFVAAAALPPDAGALGRMRPSPTGPARIVSLSPAVTETLFAIGAGEAVVGVSDFCDAPAADALPRAGTSITPAYERIAALRPTAVVTTSSPAARTEALGTFTHPLDLPWLTIGEVAASTRALGAVSGRRAAAEALARRIEGELGMTPPPDAPRLLVVLPAATPLTEVWFVRANSLHGSAITAAGARNAIARPVAGAPVLSLEGLLAVDPDVIVVLGGGDAGAAATLNELRRLETLAAVRNRRLHALSDSGLLIPGPRILDLVAALQALLQQRTLP